MPYDEADEAVDGMFEADEAADEGFDEAVRSWSRLRPKVASGRSTFSPRPQSQYVTQTQLQTALAKVGGQISTNSAAITKVGGQVSHVMGTLNKEIADRKKDFTTLRSNLSQTQQMAAIMPLLTQSNSLTLSGNVPVDAAQSQIDSGTRLPIQSNTLNLLLPMLLLGGVGDSTGSGTGGGLFGGGDNNSMMMMVLVLALSSR
jgi:hypothetical protein